MDDDVLERFADSVAAVPPGEPLLEGLIRRAHTEGLRSLLAGYQLDDRMRALALAELRRRGDS